MSIAYVSRTGKSIALLYLARGADADHVGSFRRFAHSYRNVPAGAQHTFFVIFKGFKDDEHLRSCQEIFTGIDYHAILTSDDAFDIGAYVVAGRQISHDRISCLNTNSEIVGPGWLGKLAANLDQKGVGMVGATGSFESLRAWDSRFPDFPNVHIRSNAFMMDRERMLAILSRFRFREKADAWLAESGPDSLTRRVFDEGLTALIVGKDGRGYPPQWWPVSQAYRRGTQSNLLVHDNITRAFERMPWPRKDEQIVHTWGKYFNHEATMLLPEFSN